MSILVLLYVKSEQLDACHDRGKANFVIHFSRNVDSGCFNSRLDFDLPL